MSTEMKHFLRQGMRLYCQAQHTLAAFDRQAEKLLDGALGKRRSWSPLKQCQVEPAAKGGTGTFGWWVAVAVQGKTPRGEKAEIDCGIWWDVLVPNEPVLYASFRQTPKRLLKFRWPKSKNGIRSVDHYGRTILYLPMPQSADIVKPLDALLDALLRQAC